MNKSEFMSSRERVLKSLNFEEPDRVPYNSRLVYELEKAVENGLDTGIDCHRYFNDDILIVGYDDYEWYDRWYQNMGFNNFSLPDDENVKKLKEKIEIVRLDGRVTVNAYIAGVYEHIKKILGDEQALVDMYLDPDRLMGDIEKVAEWLIRLNEITAGAGLDICWIGDDIGAQNSLIMSPKNYRKFYKPFHKEQVARIKKANPGTKVAFHCCGHIGPLIPELIDIGVDILEAVQPEANNDLKFIKKEYGRHITFWGAVSTQRLFFNTTPDEVVEGVRETIEIMAEGGGYIAAPCHTLTQEVSVDNVKAFYDAVNKYGYYKF